MTELASRAILSLDEEAAKQATDYIDFVFNKDNPGYRVLWDATQDALLLGNGIVKHYWDTTAGRLAVECIEPENFLMDGNARSTETSHD